MKLLFDHNLSPSLVNRLADIFPESNHVYLMKLDQTRDMVIWEIAKTQSYIFVTKDSDFNELVILKGFPPKVIWIRAGNCTTNTIELLLRSNYQAILAFYQDTTTGIICLS